MKPSHWQDILVPPGDDEKTWELFHENSKIGRHSFAAPAEEVRKRMAQFYESLPYEGYPVIHLPSASPLSIPLDSVLTARASHREMFPATLSLEDTSTFLHYAYGPMRKNSTSSIPRSFRAVPSGGALYPLELFFYSSRVEGLEAGCYHYNPDQAHVRRVLSGDHSPRLSRALVQPDIIHCSSILFFITSVFERTVFKYGNRGYRFALLETGHVAQNLNLVAGALGLGCLNIGGFFDREVD